MIDSMFMFRKQEKIILLIGILFFVLFPFFIKNMFAIHLMITVLLYSTMGLSWNILGSAGVVSLGHTFFYGVGAYISSCLLIFFGVNPWIGMIIAALVNLLVGIVVGNMFFKLSGHYFAIATIALAEIARIIVVNWEKIGGAVGLFLPFVDKSSLVKFQFISSKVPYYFIILIFFCICFLASNYVFKSKFGYYLKAIKASPEAARSLGIDIKQCKVIAIAISAVVMSIMGTFMAQYVLYLSPETFFVFNISLYALLVAVVGGLGTTWGPVIGASILVLISEMFRIYIGGTGQALDLMIYGLLIMLIAVFQPSGIMGIRLGKKGKVEFKEEGARR